MGYLEGGAWIAFANADDDDYAALRHLDGFEEWETVTWFDTHRNLVGLGTTPNDAVHDLMRKLQTGDE